MRVNPFVPLRLKLYVACVVVAGLAAIGHSILALHAHPIGTTWLILAALTLFSGSFTIKVPSVPARISVSETFVFTAALLFGAAPATLIVALDGFIVSLLRTNRRLHRMLFNGAEPALSIWLASRLFSVLAGSGGTTVSAAGGITPLIVPLLALAATYFLLNSWLTAVAVSLETGAPARRVWRQHFLWLSLNYFGGASVAILLARNAPGLDIGALNVVLPAVSVILPLLVISYLTFKGAMGRVEDATEHLSQLNSLYLSTLETLALAIDAKDQVTHGHIRRVQTIAVRLAKRLGIRDDSLLQALEAAALLHDIGKIGVPEHILNKPGKLSQAEYDRMKLHASIGADLVSTIHFRNLAVPIVRHHHENWDGTGYPDGLAGTNIPIGARILSVVDCFDALTSDRPYRHRLREDQALSILLERRGTMYDPLVVDAFLDVHRELAAEPTEIQADHNEFAKLPPLGGDVLDPELLGVPDSDDPRESGEELLTILDLAKAMSGSVGLADASELIWNRLRHMFPASSCVFYLYEPESDELVARASLGEGASSMKGRRIQLGHGVAGWVAVNRRTIVNADPSLDLSEKTAAVRPSPASCLTAPLALDNELVGVLSLFSTVVPAFSEDHRRLIELLAPQLARSVTDAADFDAWRITRLRDTVTGLPNALRLSQLVARGDVFGEKTGHPVAVVLLGVQGLPAITQRLGLTLSDLALAHVTAVVRSTLRAADILFRSDSDEFAVLLSQTDVGTADGIAARVLVAIAERPLVLTDGSRLELRLAAGVASQPIDGLTLDTVMAAARRRMFAGAFKIVHESPTIH